MHKLSFNCADMNVARSQVCVMRRGLNQRWRNFRSLVETGLVASKMTSNAENAHFTIFNIFTSSYRIKSY